MGLFPNIPKIKRGLLWSSMLPYFSSSEERYLQGMPTYRLCPFCFVFWDWRVLVLVVLRASVTSGHHTFLIMWRSSLSRRTCYMMFGDRFLGLLCIFTWLLLGFKDMYGLLWWHFLDQVCVAHASFWEASSFLPFCWIMWTWAIPPSSPSGSAPTPMSFSSSKTCSQRVGVASSIIDGNIPQKDGLCL